MQKMFSCEQIGLCFQHLTIIIEFLHTIWQKLSFIWMEPSFCRQWRWYHYVLLYQVIVQAVEGNASINSPWIACWFYLGNFKEILGKFCSFSLRLEQRKLVSLVYNLAALLPQVRDLPPGIVAPLYDVLPNCILMYPSTIVQSFIKTLGAPVLLGKIFLLRL